jgi:8-oxo-dGTP diphosphatase
MMYDNIRVGLGLVLVKDGSVLLSQRKKDNNGIGEFGGPGGALEPGEAMGESILRELSEECGPNIAVNNLRAICTINYRNDQSPTHWVGVGFIADYVYGTIVNNEPDKHSDWAWYPLDKLPTPLYWPVARYIESYTTGKNFFEL